jgi:hypothetical protein
MLRRSRLFATSLAGFAAAAALVAGPVASSAQADSNSCANGNPDCSTIHTYPDGRILSAHYHRHTADGSLVTITEIKGGYFTTAPSVAAVYVVSNGTTVFSGLASYSGQTIDRQLPAGIWISHNSSSYVEWKACWGNTCVSHTLSPNDF